MFGWTTKKIETAENNKTKEVTAVELWYVKWTSRDGEYSHCLNKEVEAFPLRQDAEDFAQALRNAFKLIRHTSNTHVTVSKKS